MSLSLRTSLIVIVSNAASASAFTVIAAPLCRQQQCASALPMRSSKVTCSFMDDLKKGFEAGMNPAADSDAQGETEQPSTPAAKSAETAPKTAAANPPAATFTVASPDDGEPAAATFTVAAPDSDDKPAAATTTAPSGAMDSQAGATDDAPAAVEAEDALQSTGMSAAEEAMFAKAVEQAQASKAAADAQRGGIGGYADSLVEPSSAAAPLTAAEQAAAEALRAKERAQDELMAMPSAASGLMGQMFSNMKNIGKAMGEALDEANAKRAAEEAARPPQKKRPRGNLNQLYKELDAAIDRDDWEKAKQIKDTIDAIKG